MESIHTDTDATDHGIQLPNSTIQDPHVHLVHVINRTCNIETICCLAAPSHHSSVVQLCLQLWRSGGLEISLGISRKLWSLAIRANSLHILQSGKQASLRAPFIPKKSQSTLTNYHMAVYKVLYRHAYTHTTLLHPPWKCRKLWSGTQQQFISSYATVKHRDEELHAK